MQIRGVQARLGPWQACLQTVIGKLSGSGKLLARDYWCRSVTTCEITLANRLFFSGVEISQRIKSGAPIMELLCEPDLVPSKNSFTHGVAKQRRFV